MRSRRPDARFNRGRIATAAGTPGPPPAYLPSNEGGAVLWVDLNDPANYTLAGGFITAINNKISGAPINALTVGAPFEATGINGKPCVHTLLTTQQLSSTEAAVLAALTNAHAYTLAYYVSYDAADPIAAGNVFSVGGVAASPRRTWGQNGTGGGRQVSTSVNDAAAAVTNAAAADNSLAVGHTVIWASSGTVESCHVNNSAPDPNAGANNPGTLTPTKFTLFGRNEATPSAPLIGRCSEIWLFDKELDAAALVRVYTFLSDKWS